MSKYDKLKHHLNHRNENSWHASFAEIENVLSNKLPASARKHQAWWSNQAGEGHSQSASWQNAGWKTEDLDLENERVTFRRNSVSPETANQLDKSGLTIAEAKAELAKTFGVSPKNIEIIIKG